MARAASPDYASWAANPAEPGASLPPAGRSLFDHLVSNGRDGYDLPFPFTALLEQLALRAHCKHADTSYQDCYRAVLIPLGRSLQRGAVRDVSESAQGEDFFKFPRAVFAMVEDNARTAAAPFAKDRLYLGYHESAGVLEVISYNEAAARFEFQIVKDYRAGGSAKLIYANRAVCVACHQNHAPIFSRQVWDESNANPAIAQRLLATGRQFYGVKVDRGVDIPQAIDNAVNRANLFAAQQLLWQRGCGGDDVAARRCRSAAYAAALQYALSGELGYDSADPHWRDDFGEAFAAHWIKRWPDGLKLSDAGLPNRDPLQSEQATRFAHVAAKFEPLQPRAHGAVWQRTEAQRQLVAGIAATLTRADLRALNEGLARKRAKSAMRAYTERCAIARQARRTAFECASADARLRLRGSVQRDTRGTLSGMIDELSLPDGARLSALELSDVKATGVRDYSATLRREALPARNTQGHLLARFTLREATPQSGSASVEVVEDFSTLRAALARMADDANNDAFTAAPFQRAKLLAALLRELGLPQQKRCCSDTARMPPAQTDAAPTAATDSDLAPFFRYCATCHQSNERSPPNFLHPEGAAPAQGVQHCAPRIYYRLAMWQLAPQARQKTPMPPQIALQSTYAHADAWPRSTELAAMQAYAARAIKELDARALLARPYETLRSCLPARSTLGAQQ